MRKCLVLVALFFTVLSCDIINPEEDVPGYFIVNSIDVETAPLQGGPTSNITHTWLFQDGNNIGGFPFPSRIPILGEEEKELILSAGVQINGSSQSAVIYPFYTQQTFNVSLEPDERREVDLTLSYKENARFLMVEDFEFNNPFEMNLDDFDGSNLTISVESSASGSNAGLMTVDSENPSIIVATNIVLDEVPINGTSVFLEIDYKNEVPFSIGLIGVAGATEISQEFIGLNARDDWNKVYVDFTDFVSDAGFTSYRIFFRAQYDSSLGEFNKVFVDNIKFITF